MSVLGTVASSRKAALHVVKVGSASQSQPTVYDGLALLRRRGARLLLVAGGAAGVRAHYAAVGRTVRTVQMPGGEQVRYCPPEEMKHLIDAYETVTLPRIRQELQARGLSVFAGTAQSGALVSGTVNRPLVTLQQGRRRIVRDHRAGTFAGAAVQRLEALLDAFDVVCLSPPVTDAAGGSPLNVDADVLAAELANILDADHLRLVTGTPGLLRNPGDPHSRIPDLTPGEGQQFARGRMRQKVRAAEIALRGAGDVAICGPHVVSPVSGTRCWRAAAPAPDLTLLSHAVELSSVSGDERELADYLVAWCTERGVDAGVDQRGNFVATRGSGPRRLLMLGHLDTVPHRWPARWSADTLSGRGCVDAKGSLVGFLQTLAALEPPPGTQVRVVGAVEEENTSAGAVHVRDHYAADAVIVGEPSGARALTIGYHGLLKVRITVEDPVGHTAGHGVVTAADQLTDIVADLRRRITAEAPDAMVATLGLHAVNAGDRQQGECVIDVRVPPSSTPERLTHLVRLSAGTERVEVLRATPAARTARTNPLVQSFNRAFHAEQVTPRFLAKRGSSDMNTLATTWTSVPWVAYGPGDASLDHTPHEHIQADEVRLAQRVLGHAVTQWLADTRPLAAAGATTATEPTATEPTAGASTAT